DLPQFRGARHSRTLAAAWLQGVYPLLGQSATHTRCCAVPLRGSPASLPDCSRSTALVSVLASALLNVYSKSTIDRRICQARFSPGLPMHPCYTPRVRAST